MFAFILLAFAVTACAGLVVKFLLHRYSEECEITWREFIVGLSIALIAVIPLVTMVGWRLARSNLVTFHEYWNGWELRAERRDIACIRDGPCHYEYDCDPYVVLVPYQSCSGIGEDEVCTTEYRPETRYHSCPYVTVETDYWIRTTLGEYTIAVHRFPEHPDRHRWRASVRVPDEVSNRAGVGIPPFWAAAKARIDAGRPGPVTKRFEYENYILASEHTILKQYSGDIASFRSAGFLPALQKEIRDFYYADKVYFVGYRPENAARWQDALAYFNAGFGSEFEGDLHLVIVQSERISGNPDAFALALKAYWQDASVFGKNAFSKNGMCVIVGTDDGKTISWGRAFTGMPTGNEELRVRLQHILKDIPLNPESVIGVVRGEFRSATLVRSVAEGGALAHVLMSDAATKFKRVPMGGPSDGGESVGFAYLWNEIQPTRSQQVRIFVTTFLVCGVIWFIAAVRGEKARHEIRRRW